MILQRIFEGFFIAQEDRLAAEGTPPDLCIRFSDGAVKGSIRFRPYTKVRVFGRFFPSRSLSGRVEVNRVTRVCG